MAKLPSVQDLGATPQAPSSRAVGTFDPSPIARGAQQIAQATSSIGKSVADVGGAIGDVALDKARYEFATAHSNFLARQIDLHSTMQTDTDYATMPQRYQDQMQQIQDDAASKISVPGLQSRFKDTIAPQVAHGTAQIQERANGLEGNANIAYIRQQGDKFIDQSVANPTADGMFDQISKSYNNLVDAATARGWYTPENALKEKQDWTHRYAIASAQAQAEYDPQGVLNRLRASPGSMDQVLNRIHQVEGTGAAGTSSAAGHFQFTNQTWLNQFKQHADELSPELGNLAKQIHPDGNKLTVDDPDALKTILAMRGSSAVARTMAGHLLDDNAAALKSAGNPTDAGSLYLAHFLGAGGANKVLSANPNTPVATLLSPDAVAANRSILQGKTAGDVIAWSAGKMGGVGPGGGHEFDFLRPDQRAMLIQHVEGKLHDKTASDITSFHNSVQDDVAQAYKIGGVAQPKTEQDFISRYGADRGPIEARNYQDQLQVGADMQRVKTMTPAEQNELVASYEPKSDEPGFAEKTARQIQLQKSVDGITKERADDAAAFTINRIPGMQDDWMNFQKVAGDQTVPLAQKQQAARDVATRMIMEQQHVKIPEGQQSIVPKSYIDDLQNRLKKPEAAGGTSGVYNTITNEAQIWGDNWPKVYKQFAKTAMPAAQVIGSGVKPFEGKLIAELNDQNVKEILKDQSDEKASQIHTDVLEAFKPMMRSMDDNEGAQKTFDTWRGQAEKVAAWYVEHGSTSKDAATKTYDALFGYKYDTSHGYRVPTDPTFPYQPNVVHAGAAAALERLGGPSASTDNLAAADREMNLTAQERSLYQRHLSNLTGPGGVDNPDGSRSSLYQSVQEHNGKFYNIPTVWNGKIETEKWTDPKTAKTWDVPNARALKNVEAAGWESFPSYASPDEADARYEKMHDYMERDTEQFLKGRKEGPDLSIMPDKSRAGGVSDDYLQKQTVLTRQRDAKWVSVSGDPGLALIYDHSPVLRKDGTPIQLSWDQLASLGKQAGKAVDALGVPQ